MSATRSAVRWLRIWAHAPLLHVPLAVAQVLLAVGMVAVKGSGAVVAWALVVVVALQSVVIALASLSNYAARRALAEWPSAGVVKGCCDSCQGRGGTTSGPCWDCRGTGCAHPGPRCRGSR